MALQITLVKTPTTVAVAKTSHSFNKFGGTLGRGESNVWALPDPEKFLSSCHCEILFEGNAYFLLDLSTNGTFLNGAFEPLGKGSRARLKHGDSFEIGEFKFSITLVDDQPFGDAPGFVAPPVAQGAAPFDDIFGGPPPQHSPFAPSPFATGGNGFLSADLDLQPDSQNVDPLAAFDRAHKVAPAKVFGDPSGFDSLVGSRPKPNPFTANMGQVDHSPSLDQAISWPSSSQENLIPEDWEDDLLGSPQPAPFAPNPRPAPGRPPVAPPPAFFDEDPMPAQDVFSEPLPVARPAPVQRPIPATPPARAFEPESVEHLFAQPQAIPVPPPVVQAPAPAPIPVIPAAPAQPARVTQPNNQLIDAMGLDAKNLTPEQISEINDKVGELVREIVGGMMQVLRSRTSIKNEFRMNVTTIQPVENNPLKFSVGVDEALENMFLKKTNAYKKPLESFREGFQEIGEHQLAMIAGIRFGFERMMERFNPENLETIFNKQGKGGGVLPGMQKAKYWNSYKEHYDSFSDNMESSFQHLFGSDFVDAYEDQLRKLAAARKNK